MRRVGSSRVGRPHLGLARLRLLALTILGGAASALARGHSGLWSIKGVRMPRNAG